MTGETIVDPARLADHLAEIARTGVATEHDEAVLGESIAATIFDAPRRRGAIAVVCSLGMAAAPVATRRRPRSRPKHLRELGASGWPVYNVYTADAEPAAGA